MANTARNNAFGTQATPNADIILSADTSPFIVALGGSYSVEVNPSEQTLTIQNCRILLSLNQDETYHLYALLHTLFA